MDASDALESLDTDHVLVKCVNSRARAVFSVSWDAPLEDFLLDGKSSPPVVYSRSCHYHLYPIVGYPPLPPALVIYSHS